MQSTNSTSKEKNNFNISNNTIVKTIIKSNSSYTDEKNHKIIWNDIVEENKRKCIEYNELLKIRNTPNELPKEIYEKTTINYVEKEIFPLLLQALESALFKAKENNSLRNAKTIFNGIDHISEYLWNKNQNHPMRNKKYLNIFYIPWVKDYLKIHPRPYYPYSWIWTEDEAVLRIQKFYRGYLVRKLEEVQEMRQFWKAWKKEKYLEIHKPDENDKTDCTCFKNTYDMK